MSNVVPFQRPEPRGGHLICPTCGEAPEQRIDTDIDADGVTIAAAVCTQGHLFVTQWEVK